MNMFRTARSHKPLVAFVVTLVLSACGSTVQLKDQAAGLGATSGQASSALNQGLGVTNPSAPVVGATGIATTQGSGAQGGADAGPETSALPPSKTSGPGFTATQIRIGVAYDSTFSQELGSAGVSSGSTTVGDQQAQINAIVKDINSRGGIAGRKIVPIFFDTKGLTSQNDPNTLAQSACSKWTEDRSVFAAMTYVVQMDNETLYNCLARHQVLFVPLGGESQGVFNRYSPYLWSPAGVAVERISPVWIQRLIALGYFGGWNTTLGQPGNAPVKIGLLYGNGIRNNQPQLDKAFVDSVKKALAAHGRTISEMFEVTQNTADESAAVLKFNNAHITHVIGDYSLVNFTQAAESQAYRPRYGFTSFSPGISFNLFAPPQQLRGALGIGWIPAGDVENAQDPGDVSAAEAHCRDVMRAAGEPTSTRLAWFAMTWACDTFNFFAAAIKAGGLSPTGVQRGAAALGSMPPVATFSISFPRGRPDGVSAIRDLGYRNDCRCFAYLSRQNRAL